MKEETIIEAFKELYKDSKISWDNFPTHPLHPLYGAYINFKEGVNWALKQI